MLALLSPVAVSAAPSDVLNESCKNSGNSALCQGQKQQLFGPAGVFTKIINTIIFVIGAVAVIMVVIGGFRYVVSNGDSSSVTSAKNTILYAIVGLIVAMLAYAIVNFVISAF
ncbi:MAG TPA: hypothetical protein VNI82_00045 [Candidatus Nitrosotenuis sp.]|nr:hypothetical protein [Candidatus Nitrosotenuis sp.]